MITKLTAAASVLALTATAGLAQSAEQLLDQRASTGGLVGPIEEVIIAPAAAATSVSPLVAVGAGVLAVAAIAALADDDDDDEEDGVTPETPLLD